MSPTHKTERRAGEVPDGAYFPPFPIPQPPLKKGVGGLGFQYDPDNPLITFDERPCQLIDNVLAPLPNVLCVVLVH